MGDLERLKSYHRAWLSVHPERTERWLADRLADGFNIHHMDENHDNDEPGNLILVESLDHMRVLHKRTRPIILKSETARRMSLKRWAAIPPEKRKKMMRKLTRARYSRRRRKQREAANAIAQQA